jgi:hypothetical protein
MNEGANLIKTGVGGYMRSMIDHKQNLRTGTEDGNWEMGSTVQCSDLDRGI